MTTPERILEYLRKHPNASAPDLSQATGMTVQNMRHHLQSLERQGWIEEVPTSTNGHRGRPQKRYRLSVRSKTGESLPLLHALLYVYLSDNTTSEPERLTQLAKHLAGVDLTAAQNPAQRLNRAVKRMNELGYQIRWEARPRNPQLYITYSPYKMFYADFPTLAGLDALLVQVMTGYRLNRIPGRSVHRNEDVHQYSIEVE